MFESDEHDSGFDLSDSGKTRLKKDSPIDRMPSHDGRFDADENYAEDDASSDLFERLISYYRKELDRQEENRAQMATDEDFYDHIQWDQSDAEEIAARGQAPIVYNVLAQTVNWIIGTEKRGRSDFHILPREKEDAQPAQKKTKLLKYLSDVNRTPFHRSRAFEDCVKAGLGWLEDGAQDDDDDQEVIYSRYESWRNILWDSASTEMDLSDARYLFRSRWVDVDIAKALAPEKDNLIDLSAVDGLVIGRSEQFSDEAMDSWEYDNERYGVSSVTGVSARQRVRLIEAWYRKPARIKKINGGTFHGETVDPGNAEMQAEIKAGEAKVHEKVQMQTHVAIMTTRGILLTGESPYKHRRFPFTPIWCYRRARDGMPYGVIRGLRDIQEDINKRASKALYIMSTNKTLAPDGFVDDIEEWREESAKPDAVLTYKTGMKPELNVDRGLDQAHLDFMARGINMIEQVGGVTDEQMGRTTNATSGKAIERRQNQGALTTSKIFDNHRFAFQLQGEIQVSLIEQFFDEQKTFRVTNDRGTPEYVTVNDGLPDNDIIRSKADFVIAEGDWRNSIREAQADQLMEMLTRMPPQVAIVLLDLVVENMDLPNREDIVQRIRSISGQIDPDLDEDSPEYQKAMQGIMAKQQADKAMFDAELDEKRGKASKAIAEAKRSMRQAVGDATDAQKTALEAAMAALADPQAALVADGILKESGWDEATGGEQAAQQPQPQPDQQAAQQTMQQGLPAPEEQPL
ncbi:hypothetical protein [Zhongshania sp.]|uniref:portal protein n=1 Tax=Zhongshania sp. TaxID=1971902 RepID=UPI003569F1C5